MNKSEQKTQESDPQAFCSVGPRAASLRTVDYEKVIQGSNSDHPCVP